MAKLNKYRYLSVVQGNYAGYWEDLDEDENKEAMEISLGEYVFSAPTHKHRIIRRRVLN